MRVKWDTLSPKNAASFQGELYYVNPKGGELFGRPLFQNVEAIPGDVDMAVLVIPASSVIPTIEKLVLKNLKNLVIITAGFKESGNEEDELKIAELAKKHNFNVIGPNCLGYSTPKAISISPLEAPMCTRGILRSSPNPVQCLLH